MTIYLNSFLKNKYCFFAGLLLALLSLSSVVHAEESSAERAFRRNVSTMTLRLEAMEQKIASLEKMTQEIHAILAHMQEQMKQEHKQIRHFVRRN